MKTFIELFSIILIGDKEASRQAAREVRKLVYSSSDQYKDIKSIIENAPAEYQKIIDDWRQENFVMAISVMYFLHGEEKQPDFLFPWLFHLIQHPNGYIRHAAVRMLQNEIGPLTVHIRCPGHEPGYFGKLTSEQSDFILHALFVNLNILSSILRKPEYKKYKYIDSLPVSPYKSVQMVLADLEDYCGEEYLDRLINQ